MKSMKRIAVLCVCWLCTLAGFAAMTTSEVRNNARFMTDRMAHELGLSSMQRDDVYEINYDFFESVRYVMDDLADGYAYAIDRYYANLDLRNDDLSHVLTRSQFERFMNRDYFYRPLYVENRSCRIRIYTVYHNPTFFYFAAPLHFHTYAGVHSRVHYTHGFYCNRYHHPRYTGAWVHPSHHTHYAYYRRHDFGPGIAGRPVRPPHAPQPSRPSRPNVRPPQEHRPSRPNVRPPQEHRPSRPNVRPPQEHRPSRPGVRPPQEHRPSRPNVRPPQEHRPSRPNVRPSQEHRPSRPSVRPSQEHRPSRPSVRPSERPKRDGQRPQRKNENERSRNTYKV